MDNDIINNVGKITDRVPILWDLKVFLLRVWMILSPAPERRISLLLTDETGNRIEAVVLGDDVENFKYATWCENEWFHLRDPTVEVNNGYESLTPHPFKLKFNSRTSFRRIYSDLPVVNFTKYPTFSDISDQASEEAYPKDFVGVITRVGNIQYGWRGPRVQFTLRDLELRSIQCLFYSKAASKLVRNFKKDAEKHLFVILRCFCMKKSGGYIWLVGQKYPATIKYEQFQNESWNDFRNRFPNPVPENYPEENLMSWFIY